MYLPRLWWQSFQVSAPEPDHWARCCQSVQIEIEHEVAKKKDSDFCLIIPCFIL